MKIIIMLKFCFFSFLFMGLGVCIPVAHAVTTLDAKPLKKIEFMPVEAFEGATQEVSEVPNKDDLLAYKVRLPLGWTKGETPIVDKRKGKKKSDVAVEPSAVSLELLGGIVRYDAPPDVGARAYFIMEALELDYEITARSWFINYILENGYSLEGLDEKSDREVEALYVQVQGDSTFAVRLRAIVNGPRIVVVRYFVSQEQYNDQQVMQAQSLASFTLLNTAGKQIETRNVYNFLDQSYFDYPVSWTLHDREIYSIDTMKTEILNMNTKNELDGRIRITAVSKLLETTLSDEIQKFMDSFSVKDYELGEVIDRPELPHHKDLLFSRTEAYALKPIEPTMMDYEFWATVMEGDDYYYIASLLTPSRKQEYYTWTRNVEAYKIVTSSLRRYDE